MAAGLVLGSAAGAERYCEANDLERYASRETFAKVDSARVRYRLLSRDQAASPVVFLTGMIGSIEQWDLVQSGVATFAPALAYDRAGAGFSSGSSAHDAQQQGDELAALLVAVGLNRPVVVVGYSASGSVARGFAAQHPAQVSALVLVEPTLPELDTRLPTRHGPWRTYGRTLGTCSLLSLFGVRRLANQFGFLKFQPLPRTEMDYRAQAVLQRFSHWWAFDRELLAQAASEREVLAGTSVEDRPLVIFSAESSGEDETARAYAQLLQEYASAHKGVMTSLGAVDHSVVLNQPESVKRIVEGLRDLTVKLRRD